MSDARISSWKIWWLAIRPKTLPAAMGPVFVGTGAAIHDGFFDFLPALAALIGAVLLQILSNLANDYYDFLKGFDTKERTGPVRVTASGMLSLKQMRIGILVNIILALIIGLYLIIEEGGLIVLTIGIFSLIFAVLYSGGPYPLSTIGMGDIFVFIFFGLVAVGGTYFVQANTFHPLLLLIATPPGLIITAILIVNNYRDIETDKEVGKFTLAVFLGHRNSQIYYIIILALAYAVPFILLAKSYTLLVLLPLLTIYFAVPLIQNVLASNEGPIMNQTLAGTAKLSLIYSILFAIGLAY